ncbi:hypothetical protein SAMN05216388_101795 [Halorientalis persicus]|uniref:Uncharacterized protein n=1 Tax=Halorientalis persicus TaxID=1367881 RepID=A0A1H8S011_9EURY|nr:hypothetical protein [Halorientalis persicus]SEO71866.1 hypothetical protein SAMN05216388_101795 [Halorientalis persicus]
MPTDTKLTQDRDISIDPTGDIATVTGRDNVRQQHVNAIFRAADAFDAQLGGIDAELDFETALGEELDALQYVQSYSVDATYESPGTLRATVESDALDQPVTEEADA